MNIDEYLARLQVQFKGLPSEMQADLIEEISTHLAEGQADVRLGTDLAEREKRLVNEMGTPEDMGRRMKNIHRHNRWLDYLLVVVPAQILIPLIDMVLLWFLPHTETGQAIDAIFIYWGIRASILIHLILIGICIRRYHRFGDAGLAIYWLAETFWIVCAICLREKRWNQQGFYNQTSGGMVETVFWLVVLVGLGIGIFRIIVRSKELLITVLALLPFCLAAGNLITGQMIISGNFPDGYHFPQWVLGYFGPSQVASVVWPALFFLFRQRTVRWLGLLAYAVPLALMNLVAAVQYPGLVMLWSLPLLLVLAGWALDIYNQQKRKALVR